MLFNYENMKFNDNKKLIKTFIKTITHFSHIIYILFLKFIKSDFDFAHLMGVSSVSCEH